MAVVEPIEAWSGGPTALIKHCSEGKWHLSYEISQSSMFHRAVQRQSPSIQLTVTLLFFASRNMDR